MIKKLLIFVLFLSFVTSFSQHVIHGEMKPAKEYTWAILYQLTGANQTYITNTTIKNGVFSITMKEDASTGIYRLLYDNTNNLYIDFIYNKENVSFEFHPEYPTELVAFYKSEENKIYQDYLGKISKIQKKLDSLQVIYFQTDSRLEEKKADKIYVKEKKTLIATQSTYEKDSENKIAHHYIVANKHFYSETLIKNPEEYLDNLKKHYFDAIDFDNKILNNSSLFTDRISNYIFYLNTSNDPEFLIKMYKKSITHVMSLIEKEPLKKTILEYLLYTFGQQEAVEMVSYLFDNHYVKLPPKQQDPGFQQMIKDMLKTTIGMKAPNLVWKEKNKEKSLYKLQGKKHYLVVFWSTTCTHCLQEMPLLQKYLKDKPDIQVIAIGLESEESKITWIDEQHYYEEFIHVLGKNKYENDFVRDYGVDSTPNFFLLNSDKIIISKPYDVKELIEVYPKINAKSKIKAN